MIILTVFVVCLQDSHYKRPGTLELHSFAEQDDAVAATANVQERKRPELTNFNADEFIADLPFKLVFCF